MQRPVRIALLAGEPSGDVLGGSLLEALKSRYPNAEFAGIGGPQMQAQGFDSWFNMETLSIMGLVEVLKRLPTLFRLKKELIQRLLAWQPDLFIGIDAPDFNLRVEKELKEQGIKTVHYVSPSVWAWRQKRIFKIDKATDLVLALLPFEKQFYDKHNVACEFVGHTLADEIPLHTPKEPARAELGLAADAQVVAIMPGSRGSEVAMLGETFLQTAQELAKSRPELEFVIPAANEARYQQLAELLKAFPDLKVKLIQGNARAAMAAADAILLASGTVALEAMLVKRPMVVAYKVNALTYRIVKALAKVDHVSLPNLLANERLVPEIIQHEMTVERLVKELGQQLDQPSEPLLKRFEALHQTIRLDASARAADYIDVLLKQSRSQEA